MAGQKSSHVIEDLGLLAAGALDDLVHPDICEGEGRGGRNRSVSGLAWWGVACEHAQTFINKWLCRKKNLHQTFISHPGFNIC